MTLTSVLLVAVLLWPAVQPALPDDAPFVAFQAKVLEYVRLRQRLRSEITALALTNNPETIANTSAALAAAIQRARRGAKMGDIFDKTAVSEIRRRVRAALQGVDVAAFMRDINDESTFRGQPRVHLRYPEAMPMATMPPALLNVLPPLPEELEYRLLGRHLVLRDRDAALVIDYVADVIPPR